jgi:hypothetical protein
MQIKKIDSHIFLKGSEMLIYDLNKRFLESNYKDGLYKLSQYIR